jgi:hypothetical protein
MGKEDKIVVNKKRRKGSGAEILSNKLFSKLDISELAARAIAGMGGGPNVARWPN